MHEVNFFDVSVQRYCADKSFHVFRPASLNKPKCNSVMFIQKEYMDFANVFMEISECLIFWPNEIEVPESIDSRHAVVRCPDSHLKFCVFFSENDITNLPPKEPVIAMDGYFISPKVHVHSDVTIMPGAYVGGDIVLGHDVYIGAGTKLMGRVTIGNNVVIRENTVIGADGLTTDRNANGQAVTMPQFGGVVIEDNVQIGANTVIARGAIDDTVIGRGCKIDNSCFISHNVLLGADTFIVGETIMFGSSSTEEQVMISGNSTIRNGVHIGSRALVGMGSVVVKPVPSCAIVKGNPAK